LIHPPPHKRGSLFTQSQDPFPPLHGGCNCSPFDFQLFFLYSGGGFFSVNSFVPPWTLFPSRSFFFPFFFSFRLSYRGGWGEAPPENNTSLKKNLTTPKNPQRTPPKNPPPKPNKRPKNLPPKPSHTKKPPSPPKLPPKTQKLGRGLHFYRFPGFNADTFGMALSFGYAFFSFQMNFCLVCCFPP